MGSIVAVIRSQIDTEGDVSDGKSGASPDPKAKCRDAECVQDQHRDIRPDLSKASLRGFSLRCAAPDRENSR
jgi:hypothetical protein